MFELTENDIKQIYKLPFQTIKNCKFQWLQYKINNFKKEEKHKALFCNKVLQQFHELLKTSRFSCLMAIIPSVL
jgi:hypothetical protein